MTLKSPDYFPPTNTFTLKPFTETFYKEMIGSLITVGIYTGFTTDLLSIYFV